MRVRKREGDGGAAVCLAALKQHHRLCKFGNNQTGENGGLAVSEIDGLGSVNNHKSAAP